MTQYELAQKRIAEAEAEMREARQELSRLEDEQIAAQRLVNRGEASVDELAAANAKVPILARKVRGARSVVAEKEALVESARQDLENLERRRRELEENLRASKAHGGHLSRQKQQAEQDVRAAQVELQRAEQASRARRSGPKLATRTGANRRRVEGDMGMRTAPPEAGG